MADIIGCLAMSHSPQLLMPPEKWHELPARVKPPFFPKPGIEAELTMEAKRANAARCDAAIKDLKDRLEALNPDVVLIIGDDQEENIMADNMPPFTIFIGAEADAGRKFHYLGEKPLDQVKRYAMHAELGLELVEQLMAAGFDPSWSRENRYEAGLGHAFGRPLYYLMPEPNRPVVPIMLNTFYPPAPSAARCFDFGKALGDILRKSDLVGTVVVIASGGLSHTKIDEDLDGAFITALEANDTDYFRAMPADTLVHGTSELRNWIATAAVAGTVATMLDYVPCYRDENGVGCAMGFAYWDNSS